MRQTIHGACLRKKKNRKGDKRKGNEGSEKEDRATREIKPCEHTVARDRDILSQCPV